MGMGLQVGQELTLPEGFADGFISSISRKIKGRKTVVSRLFTVMGWPDRVHKVEIEFVAPTPRHKTHFMSFDLVKIERELRAAAISEPDQPTKSAT